MAVPPPKSLVPVHLSVVVVPIGDRLEKGDASGITAALTALENQTGVQPDEVIVPHCSAGAVSSLKSRNPDVRFLQVEPASPSRSSERAEELRAAGVAAARGDIVGLIEDHVRPDPDWSSAILKAHRHSFAAIGGAIENGVDRIPNWAIYFSDLGRYHNPLPTGESGFASLVNASYKRAALEQIAAVWQPRFNETAVHGALMAGGQKLALSPDIIVRQYWPDERLTAAMNEFFTWGRNYGGTRASLASPGRRIVYACMAPLIPAVLLSRSGLDTWRKHRLMAAWLKALPFSALLTLAWSCGELTGYIAGQARLHGTGTGVGLLIDQ